MSGYVCRFCGWHRNRKENIVSVWFFVIVLQWQKMYGQRLNESVYQCRVESAPQEAPPVVLIGKLSSVIVWRFHRQVLKLAEVFRFIVFQGAITPERFHRRTSICRMEGRENKSHIYSLDRNTWEGLCWKRTRFWMVMNNSRPN